MQRKTPQPIRLNNFLRMGSANKYLTLEGIKAILFSAMVGIMIFGLIKGFGYAEIMVKETIEIKMILNGQCIKQDMLEKRMDKFELTKTAMKD